MPTKPPHNRTTARRKMRTKHMVAACTADGGTRQRRTQMQSRMIGDRDVPPPTRCPTLQYVSNRLSPPTNHRHHTRRHHHHIGCSTGSSQAVQVATLHSVWVKQPQEQEQAHLVQGERWHDFVAQRGSARCRSAPRDAEGAASAVHRPHQVSPQSVQAGVAI
jgi:hypothetical protein